MRTEMLTGHYGFIVDYLSDVWRIARGGSFANTIDRWFRLGPALDRRDDKAVRRTASGLLKLVFPHGEIAEDDTRWALEVALESRRRVKEQLKRMGGLEYWQTRFTYVSSNGGPELEVTVPEQKAGGLLSDAVPAPGRVYAIGRDRSDRRPSLFSIEVELVPGTGKATLSGVRQKGVSDLVHTAWDHARNRFSELGITKAEPDRDVHVQILNPMEAAEPIGLGLGIFLGIVSILRGVGMSRASAIVGDMSVQGNILEPDAVGELVLLARENGAATLFLPNQNEADVDLLPSGLTDGLQLRFFATPTELVDAALAATPG
jgi:ATP-dependent Lon protease